VHASVTFAGSLLVVALAISAGRPQKTNPGVPAGGKSEIERGRYLVEEVAKCPECHTPCKSDGQLDSAAWLRGAPIWIRPEQPIPNWADNAPALSGLPSFTREQAERVLEKEPDRKGRSYGPLCTSTI
jgi:hypothetical protein